MTTAKVKAHERACFDEMVRLLGIELDGDPIERERPDFLFTRRDGRKIGVELVRALDESLAEGRGARARVKAKLTRALSGSKALVGVSADEYTFGALNRDARALNAEVDAIIALVRSALATPVPDGGVHFEWIDHEAVALGLEKAPDANTRDLEGTGVKHVDTISVYPLTHLQVTWSSPGRGQNPRIVQNAIDEKCASLSIYRQCGADEIWLLVIGSSGTGGALFVEDVDARQFASAFDRTVFLELFEMRCVYLNTVPPAPVQ